MDEETKQKIERYRPFWWHRFTLPDGYVIERDDVYLDTSLESKFYPENVWNIVKEHVPDLKGKKVLDIGCNAGYYSIQFAKLGAWVHGIDICQDDIDRAEQCKFISKLMLTPEEQGRVKFENIDFLTWGESGYDMIWFFGVYYHLPDHKLAMPKLNSMLNKGGILFMESAVEIKPRDCPHDAKTHRSRTHFVPSREYLFRDLEENGFEILWWKEQNRGYAGHRIKIKAKKK